MTMNDLPRVDLVGQPTPVEGLPRLSQSLGGPRILVKRDDLAGRGMGGNKTRKLEFLLADALQAGADVVLTAGATQSNHCRLTAAGAAQLGLDCVLVLGGEAPESQQGNLLLDTLMGADFVWAGAHRKGEDLPAVAAKLAGAGRRPYIVPYGGSNALGAAGYALAMQELAAQKSNQPGLQEIDCMVVASSSGGTQAGLAVGARATGYAGRIVGIGIDRETAGSPGYREHLAGLARDCARLLGVADDFRAEDFTINLDYLGGGYGVVGEAEREAIRLSGRMEGLLLDPVYTGRAMAGLIGMIRRGQIDRDETVLFWHTGGTPALFAYAHELFT